MRTVFWLRLAMCILVSGTATGPDDSHQETSVSGLTGGNITLAYLPNSAVKETVLKFQKGSQTIKIAEKKDNDFKNHHPQFEFRLKIKDGTIYIHNATINDTGKYIIFITFQNNTVIEKIVNVHVYEPVPAPSIKTENNSTGIVTLNCTVPANPTHILYGWKYRYNDSDYQLLDSTSNTLTVNLKRDMEFLCIVSNLADSKNASVKLKSHQEVIGSPQSRHLGKFLGLVVSLFFILIFVGNYITKSKKHAPCPKEEEVQNEKVKISIPDTNNCIDLEMNSSDPKEDEPFVVPEDTIKYSYCIPIHGNKPETFIEIKE